MAGKIVRKAKLEMIYRGINLSRHAVMVSYRDYAHGRLDDLQVLLEDRDLLWQGPRFPGKGETVKAKIICMDWRRQGQRMELDCGNFEIDEIEVQGPPDMVLIKAHAAKISRSARTEKKMAARENITLSAIAAEVAERAGLQLYWEGEDHYYKRVDQREKGDLAFLRGLCRDAGNNVKAAHEKLIVYSGKRYDARPPSAVIERGAAWVKRYKLGTKAHDIYREAVVRYEHPELKEMIEGRFLPPDAPPTGETLVITNRRVESAAEARKVARSRLRAKNRHEVNAYIQLVGDVEKHAAQVVALKGYGAFDGAHFVGLAVHLIDGKGGYTTDLFLRKTLGY